MGYRVTAYFNDWLGASTIRSVQYDDATLVQQTREHVPMMDGYREGDPLIESEVGEIETPILEVGDVPEGLTEEDLKRLGAAEFVYAMLNDDNRPNGNTERSLSVGDVVCVTDDEGDHWYSVDHAGFTPIEPVVVEA